MFNMLFSCCHGSTRIITDRAYTPEYMLQLVEKYKVTLLTVVPQQVASLLKTPTLVPRLELLVYNIQFKLNKPFSEN